MINTTKAVQYRKFGGPDVITTCEIALGAPSCDEVQLRHTAIGVNYLDIYQRSGVDPAISLPAFLGVEGVGEITSVGDAHSDLTKGDRVAYVGGPPGSYALHRNIAASRVIKLPDWLDAQTAAATIFKGLTAEYLIHRCISVQSGQTVLFHAAAGGVGSIACQWLRAKGVKVIGTVGSKEKVERAYANGCDHVFLSDDADLVGKIRAVDGGVDIAYDSVGAATFTASLDSLRPRGTLVSFGASSGAPPEISTADLAHRGSLYLTRPSITHYISKPEEYRFAAKRFFQALHAGDIHPPQIMALDFAQAAQSHRLMESRQTTGSLILIPEP